MRSFHAAWATCRFGCAAAICTMVACVARSKNVDRMLRIVDARTEPQAVSASLPDANCLTRRSTRSGPILGENCLIRVADTVRFSVVSADGRALMKGRRIFVDSTKLRSLADSIERAIEQTHGQAIHCKIDSATDPYTERLRLWHTQGRTWFLRTTTIVAAKALFPSIQFQSDAGTRLCDGWIPQPMLSG